MSSVPPAGSAVRATIKKIGVVHGEVVDAKINHDRIAIALWGCGRTIVVGPDEIEGLELVTLT